jgi:hypothetical protein
VEQVEFRIKRKLSRKRRPGDSKYKINGDPVLMATREIWHEILIKASSSAVYEAESVWNSGLENFARGRWK